MKFFPNAVKTLIQNPMAVGLATTAWQILRVAAQNGGEPTPVAQNGTLEPTPSAPAPTAEPYSLAAAALPYVMGLASLAGCILCIAVCYLSARDMRPRRVGTDTREVPEHTGLDFVAVNTANTIN